MNCPLTWMCLMPVSNFHSNWHQPSKNVFASFFLLTVNWILGFLKLVAHITANAESKPTEKHCFWLYLWAMDAALGIICFKLKLCFSFALTLKQVFSIHCMQSCIFLFPYSLVWVCASSSSCVCLCSVTVVVCSCASSPLCSVNSRPADFSARMD